MLGSRHCGTGMRLLKPSLFEWTLMALVSLVKMIDNYLLMLIVIVISTIV